MHSGFPSDPYNVQQQWVHYGKTLEASTTNKHTVRVPDLGTSSKYIQEKEILYLKDFTEKGYVRSPSKSFIRKQQAENDCDPTEYAYVALISKKLIDVGQLEIYSNIQILILANNYIKCIRPLACCQRLIKLDLHGNQIIQLPDSNFWSMMEGLKILNLHDNGIGQLKQVQHLGHCPQLVALTMYDTPASLKVAYRHHIVNSILTLKALDNHVISDEEIIEDASFSRGRFMMLTKLLQIELCPEVSSDSDFRAELQSVCRILTKINKILSKYSAVVVVQKMARGLIARKAFVALVQARIRAATIIQRWWANLIYQRIDPQLSIDSPSTHSVFEEPQETPDTDFFLSKNPVESEIDSCRPHIDYDAYVSAAIQKASPGQRIPYSTPRYSNNRITISLHKLHNSIQSVEEEYTNGQSPRWGRDRQRVKIVKKLGELLVSSNDREIKEINVAELDDGDMQETDGLLPVVQFRLRGLHLDISRRDKYREMIENSKASGDLLRSQHEGYHAKTSPPPPNITKTNVKGVLNENVYLKNNGCMALTSLFAVDVAYQAKDLELRMQQNLEKISRVKEWEGDMQDAVFNYRNCHWQNAINDRLRDLQRNNKLVHVRKATQNIERRNVHKDHSRRRAAHVARMAQVDFAKKFNSQKTSVSKALIRHDIKAMNEDKLIANRDIVIDAQTKKKHKARLIRATLERRRILAATEGVNDKLNNNVKIKMEKTDRLAAAKERVEQSQYQKQYFQTLFPVQLAVGNEGLQQYEVLPAIPLATTTTVPMYSPGH